MTKKEKQDRLVNLQELAAFGDLTPEQEAEVEVLEEYLKDPATTAQLDYIEVLLEKLDAVLEDYTYTAVEDLTGTEASELIDELKDDVTNSNAWDDYEGW